MTNEKQSERYVSALDNIEKFLRIVRELGLLVILGGVLLFLGPEAPRIAKELKKASLSEIDLGVLKLKVAQAQTALETALQKSSGQSGPEDGKAPEESKLIANALQSVREASSAVTSAATSGTPPPAQAISFWVYLGSRQHNAWQTVLFDVPDVPTPDSIIRSSQDVFGRRRAPEIANGQWTKGETVAVLRAGQAARVIRTQRVPGTNARDLWWAEVVPQ